MTRNGQLLNSQLFRFCLSQWLLVIPLTHKVEAEEQQAEGRTPRAAWLNRQQPGETTTGWTGVEKGEGLTQIAAQSIPNKT